MSMFANRHARVCTFGKATIVSIPYNVMFSPRFCVFFVPAANYFHNYSRQLKASNATRRNAPKKSTISGPAPCLLTMTALGRNCHRDIKLPEANTTNHSQRRVSYREDEPLETVGNDGRAFLHAPGQLWSGYKKCGYNHQLP